MVTQKMLEEVDRFVDKLLSEQEKWEALSEKDFAELDAEGFFERGGGMMSDFNDFFSMPKINSLEILPSCLRDFFPDSNKDDWFFGETIGSYIKYSYRYLNKDLIFFFSFKKLVIDEAMEKTALENDYQFTSLLFSKDKKWYRKSGFSQRDFESILNFAKGDEASNAVEQFGLKEIEFHLPLNCDVPEQGPESIEFTAEIFDGMFSNKNVIYDKKEIAENIKTFATKVANAILAEQSDQSADSNADKAPDEAGSVLKEER